LSPARGPYDMPAEEVVEVALFWGADLLRVSYVPRAARVAFAEFYVAGGEIELPEGGVGARSEARAGAFTLRATVVSAAPRVGRARPELRPLVWVLAATVAHALVLLALQWRAPVERDLDVDLLRSYVARADEASAARDAVGNGVAGHGDDASPVPGGTGKRADGDEGRMGKPESTRGAARYGLSKAPASDRLTLDEVRSFGVIGLLSNDVAEAASPWASPTLASAGELQGTMVGDAFGVSGLDLTGTGEGGGGGGGGVGLGSVGTIGHGDGVGIGQDQGPGGGACGCGEAGRLAGISFGLGHVNGAAHESRAMTCRCVDGEIEVSGRLPPETIQRVVRQSFGRFRACYEAGLARNPGLAGRVSTRFVIVRDGTVGAVADAGADLADADVGACVRRAFGALEFPAPTGGVVNVTYPIVFSSAP